MLKVAIYCIFQHMTTVVMIRLCYGLLELLSLVLLMCFLLGGGGEGVKLVKSTWLISYSVRTSGLLEST